MRATEATLTAFSKKAGVSERMIESFCRLGDDYGLVSIGDTDYPFLVNGNGSAIALEYHKRGKRAGLPNKKGAPEFLLYRGDISLLSKEGVNRNIAVIGLVNPTVEIERRERRFVSELVERGMNVVSGLAKGCDCVAHEACLERGGKTIAVLPSRLDSIIPREHSDFADEIVARGGLLVTEYYDEPSNRWDSMNRFVERDRLQAFFSKAIVLTASYRHADGKQADLYPADGIKRDSGSRHAMKAALKAGRLRLALYDSGTDAHNEMFDLNRDLIKPDSGDAPAVVLTEKTLAQACAVVVEEEMKLL